jgi:NAD(P)-dependent dehydrogenase (short-subunit alcohol dehydrogenase family)
MKNIIITGANGNLGSATVKKFLAGGYRVIAADNSSSHLSFALADNHFVFHSLNLASENEVAGFIGNAIQQNGHIHGALLLVGGFAMGNISGTDAAALRSMFSLNFETAFFCVRPLLQHMLDKRYGRIVFMGAKPALMADSGKDMIAYALSKSLLFKLADFINESAKGKNVSASIVVPSIIDTAINRNAMPDADPGNWVKPEQLADILEFICSDSGLPLRESVYKVYNNARAILL